MCEDVAVSVYGELYMILNILSGIEPAHLSSGRTRQNRDASYTRQAYVEDGTKTLVALERPRSD